MYAATVETNGVASATSARIFLKSLPESDWNVARPANGTMTGSDYQAVWATLSGRKSDTDLNILASRHLPPNGRIIDGHWFAFAIGGKSPYHSGSVSEGCCGHRYSLVLSLLSFSRMNASISGALARMRSHCSL